MRNSIRKSRSLAVFDLHVSEGLPDFEAESTWRLTNVQHRTFRLLRANPDVVYTYEGTVDSFDGGAARVELEVLLPDSPPETDRIQSLIRISAGRFREAIRLCETDGMPFHVAALAVSA